MVTTADVFGTPHAYELTPPVRSPLVLVFVHGWLLSRKYWQPLVDCLASDYQCLSYDLRGFGDSQPVSQPLHQPVSSNARLDTERVGLSAVSASHSFVAVQQPATNGRSPFPRLAQHDSSVAIAPNALSRYTPAAYAQDLVYLLKQLDISRAWIIGHSLGGSIALWASDQAPQRVRGVVSVNSGGGIYLKEEFERFRTAGQQLVKLRPRWLCQVPLLDVMMTRMNVAQPLDRYWGRQRLMDLVTAHSEAALGALLDSTTEQEVHRLPQVVSRMQQPAYFIAGANDDIMEPKYVHHLASFHHLFQCVGENVIELPNCGHFAMLEQPQLLADQIRAMVARHSD
ncbi:MAG: alpha/beta hydrolase [Synechococcales bacterium]|nr:alpha/beta hydrolase [Synechococcales bacterium]